MNNIMSFRHPNTEVAFKNLTVEGEYNTIFYFMTLYYLFRGSIFPDSITAAGVVHEVFLCITACQLVIQ